MTSDDRELGAIHARLDTIASDIAELKQDRKTDHIALVELSKALAVLIAKQAGISPPTPAQSSAAPTVSLAVGAGAASGALVTKLLTWLGIQ